MHSEEVATVARAKNRRLTPQEKSADQLALAAIRDLSDYAAVNSDYTLDRLNALDVALQEAEQQERRALNAFEAARDATIAASWVLHEALLGAKTQVIAQYGPDSNAVQSIGLKKKSERRSPRRTPAVSS